MTNMLGSSRLRGGVGLVVLVVALSACTSTGTGGPLTGPSNPTLAGIESRSCPDHDAAGPSSHGLTGLRQTLVPAGPTGALICRYGPIGEHGRPPRGTVVLGSDLGSLVQTLDGLRHIPGPQNFMCPFDDGSRFLIRFAYPDGGRLRVTVELRGCRFAWNGHLNAWADEALYSMLRSLTHPAAA
jgi:hypothetical protein